MKRAKTQNDELFAEHRSAKMGAALQKDSEMQFGPRFWTILDQKRETAQEWSLLSRFISTNKWLRGSDLN
jgi:hypothetical protein